MIFEVPFLILATEQADEQSDVVTCDDGDDEMVVLKWTTEWTGLSVLVNKGMLAADWPNLSAETHWLHYHHLAPAPTIRLPLIVRVSVLYYLCTDQRIQI